MRLILLNHHLRLRTLPNLPDDLAVLYCFEDYGVGRLDDWPDRECMKRERAGFWAACPGQELPDGSDMPYLDWHQLLPVPDMQALAKLPKRDWPPFYEFETSILQATRIEIWSDETPHDLLWRAFMVTDLIHRGIDVAILSLCVMETRMFDLPDPDHWARMLQDGPDRPVQAKPVSPTTVAHLARLWQSVRALPASPDSSLLTDDTSRALFRVMEGRFPDPVTGLTAAQRRLLCGTGLDWQKMARPIGNAMGMGWDEADSLGDNWLQMELHHLAKADPPLVEIEGVGPMRDCKVRLTAWGAQQRREIQSSNRG